MRDRLIKLLQKKYDHFCDLCGVNKDSHYTENLADYLLENGVIVPAVNVGQTVYVLGGDEESNWIDEYNVKYFYCSSKGINRYYIECGTMGNNFRPKDIGETVFLTKEEAEKALKEREKQC